MPDWDVHWDQHHGPNTPVGSKASDWISAKCRGSINREFPSEFREKALKEILDDSRAGDSAARKAWELLMTTDSKSRLFTVAVLYRSLRNGRYLPDNVWEESLLLIRAEDEAQAVSRAEAIGPPH